MRTRIAAACAGLLLSGIASCDGVPDVTFAPDDGGASTDAAAGDGTTGGNGNVEGGATGSDGGVTEGGSPLEGGGVVDGCPGFEAEVCDDGIDNDCNGKTDCADTACAAFSCQSAPPAGWAYVGFAATSRPACPTGFGTSTDVVTTPDVTGTCSCTCNEDGGSCAGGSVTLTVGDSMCLGGPAAQTVPANATCAPLQAGVAIPNNNGYAKAVALDAGPASCTPAMTFAPAATITQGRSCGTGAGRCTNPTQVCVPTASPAVPLCVMKAGSNVCPAGFAKPNHAGTSDTDLRQCTGCTCSNVACTNALTISDMNNCSGGNKDSINEDGNCAPLVKGNFTASYYKTTAAGGCAVATPPTPSGSLSLTGEVTICCK
jgi:hypothetical protein